MLLAITTWCVHVDVSLDGLSDLSGLRVNNFLTIVLWMKRDDDQKKISKMILLHAVLYVCMYEYLQYFASKDDRG